MATASLAIAQGALRRSRACLAGARGVLNLIASSDFSSSSVLATSRLPLDEAWGVGPAIPRPRLVSVRLGDGIDALAPAGRRALCTTTVAGNEAVEDGDEGREGFAQEAEESGGEEIAAFAGGEIEDDGEGAEAAAPDNGEPAQATNRRVFVTNLSYRATEEDLRGFLENEGELESVRIKYTLVDGVRQSRGFATAVFAKAEDALSAITALDDTSFQGRKIKVREDNFSKLDRKSVAHKNVEKKVFVDFLDPSLLWQDVKDHFQQTGNVYFVHLLWDQTRMHRQAVVEFGSAEEAQDAVEELNHSILREASMAVRPYHPSDMQEKEPLSPTVFVNYIHPEVELEDLNNHFLQCVPSIEYSKIFFHKTDDYQQAKVTLASTAMAKIAIEKIDRSLLNNKVIRCRSFLDNNNNSSRYLQGVWRERRVSRGPSAPRCAIENLNPRVGWQEVKDHLREAGSVVHVNVTWAEDGNTKEAVAEVSSDHDLENIVSVLNNSTLLGERIKIYKL